MTAFAAQSLLVSSALLMLGDVALGEGTYQRTRNGKTLVWNNYPKAGDEATWSGWRDGDEYARGFGTLTWYTKQSRLARPTIYARYWGNMVRGKFNGAVNVHSKRGTRYAIFADGARMTRWMNGPAPSRANAWWRMAIRRAIEPEPPAAGPGFEQSEIRRRLFRDQSERWPEPGIDDSLQALVLPPRSLRARSAGTRSAPPFAKPRLTKEEVVDLADALARTRGYDLTAYERAEAQYDAPARAWVVLYNEKPIEGTAKHFSVAVGDETKGTALVPGR